MTCMPLATANERPAPSLATKVGAVVRRRWQAYWNWRARQATILILQRLDQRTLHDIGVNPSEIASYVHSRCGDRRRCYDATWRQ